VDRIALRAIMGPSSEKMTERYAGLCLDTKRDAILKLFPNLKPRNGWSLDGP